MRSLLSSKKGQLQILIPAILVLVVAAVILIIGLVILSSIQSTSVVTNGITVIVLNESLVGVVNDSDTGPIVSRVNSVNFDNFAVTGARNTTAGTNVPISNITVNATGSVFWNNGGGGPNNDNNTNMNVNYT